MGQLKGRRAHLSVVPPVPVFEPYEIVPTAPWWTCPAWCDGDCVGGNTYVFTADKPGVTDNRLHQRAVYDTTAVDDTDGGPATVRVMLERADAQGDEPGYPSDVVVRFLDESRTEFGVRLTRAQRRELAAALLNADDLDDTAEVQPAAVAV